MASTSSNSVLVRVVGKADHTHQNDILGACGPRSPAGEYDGSILSFGCSIP